jgi:hypothetical protein
MHPHTTNHKKLTNTHQRDQTKLDKGMQGLRNLRRGAGHAHAVHAAAVHQKINR